MAEQAVRIVGRRRLVLLGLGLAALAAAPAAAQTVVGGDGRPAVTVDRSVLDSLGPQPTLPDMLLGRQPMPPPTAPVKLHPPHKSSVAAAKTAKPAAPKLAQAETEPKPKAKATKPAKLKAATPKLAEATPAPTVEKPAEKPLKKAEGSAAKSASAKPSAQSANNSGSKSLASSYETPPPPPPEPKPTVVANADMPGGTTTMTPPPAQPETPAAAPAKPAKPAKNLTSSVPMNADLPAPPPPASAPATPPAAAASTPSAPPPPAPPPASAPATPEPEAKTAMLTPPPAAVAPPPAAAEGVVMTIPFAKDGATLPSDVSALVNLAKRAVADQAMQLQVLAYASADADNASKAQRLSLARALAVRAFLKDQGVPGARIDVRALGNRVPEGSPDRVDLVEQKH
jgi:outer membrane protein OmpA-like peptidoglycan-associated protein